MPCYHPLPAYIDPRSINVDTGRGLVRFLPRDFEYKTDGLGRKFVTYDLSTGEIVYPFNVPCRQCVGCRLDHSRVWANRCTLEAMMYEEEMCWFVTLTYENPPVSYPFKKGIFDGKIDRIRDLDNPVFTLRLKDVQDFMKRLRITFKRKYNHEGIRFYLCGEYGDKTLRPHYHLVVFNMPIPDLAFFGMNRQGDYLYVSDLLEDIWGHGYVVVGKCTWNTCAYTARYVMKKAKGKEAVAAFKETGLDSEFVVMSRKPGIGVPYFEAHKDEIYQPVESHDGVLVPSGKIYLPGGRVANSCRLFDDKYSGIDTDHAVQIALMKSRRRDAAEFSEDLRRSATTLCDEEYFDLVECEKQQIAKYLEGFL